MDARRTRPETEFGAARAKVEAFIATVRPPEQHSFEITKYDDRDDFWLFSWGVRSDLWPRRGFVSMTGNVPIAVRKADGVMFAWGLLCSWDEFVERVRSGQARPLEPR
jgi:hypothetical protein